MSNYKPTDAFWSGYAGESAEGLAEINATALTMPYTSSEVESEIPDEVDYINDDKFAENWLRTENQGPVGACEGYALSETLEYNWGTITGEVIQISPMFCYLRSQHFDGINGDRGATLRGGSKAAEAGLALLQAYPLERSYPRGGVRAIPQAVIEAAIAGPYKMLKEFRMRNASDCRAFIGSFAGIIQTGTGWTRGLASVQSHGAVESIDGISLGGHSWNLAGYKPIDRLGGETRRALPWTAHDYVFVGKNSHDTRYGDRGRMYFIPEFVDELCRQLFLGRTDMGKDIKPRPSRRNFTDRKHSHFSS